MPSSSIASEFASLAGMHLLAVASPGPDFALVLRQSISFGRATAVATSVGIGSGIVVHVGYSVLGLGLLLASSPRAYFVMKIIGALYLIWLGSQALRAKPRPPEMAEFGTTSKGVPPPSRRAAFVAGFLTNATNIKATMFFVFLYSAVVSAQTPKAIQAGYGLWMAFATALWFSLVSFFFTQARIRSAFLRIGHWFDRAMGCVLIAFGVWIVVEKI